MKFDVYLQQQLQLHPATEAQDIVKQCYQAARGAEHLLLDTTAAKRFLCKEYAATPAQNIALFEPISEDVCRVNLAAWKYHALPIAWLFRMFVGSAQIQHTAADRLDCYLQIATDLIANGNCNVALSDWDAYLCKYKADGMPAVRHSEPYRTQEAPAYRIVNARYIRLLPLLEKLAPLSAKPSPCVIAIDGRAASGKSTMAQQLIDILDADLIRMDDFFLPPTLRTEDRFALPGNNVHHERFTEEVLPHLRDPKGFSYNIFDCGLMDYNGMQPVGEKAFRIVEGSYSCHPTFGKYADITVFSDISSEDQMMRILKRNGEELAEMFRTRWIPMEEAYFDFYSIRNTVDIML